MNSIVALLLVLSAGMASAACEVVVEFPATDDVEVLHFKSESEAQTFAQLVRAGESGVKTKVTCK